MAHTKTYNFGQIYYTKPLVPSISDPWYAPNTAWPKEHLKVYQLPETYSFDLELVKKEVLEIVKTFGTTVDQNADYSGLSLTAHSDYDNPLEEWHVKRSPDNSINKLGDRRMYLNRTLPNTIETPYDIETEAMSDVIRQIVAKFKSKITKVSLVQLQPGGAIVPHLDFPYYNCVRLHASIVTNDQMWYDIENGRFQVPADGNFYFFNAGLHHGVINEGNTARINLNINVQLEQETLKQYGLKYMIDNCLL